MPETKTIELECQNASGSPNVPSAAEFERWIAIALEGRQNVALTVRVVDEAEMQALNSRFRGRDKPTNVLSFPADLPAALKGKISPEPLGDIVICAEVVQAEADQQNKPHKDHWAHLTIHGLLHLLGHDHQDAQEADAMERQEIECLAALGIADPYNH